MASGSIPETTDWKLGDDVVVSESAETEPEQTIQSGSTSFLKHELKRLAQQSSHYMAGLVGNLALGFVSFPIFTRALSVSEYGIMDLGTRLLLMLTITSKLGFQNASLRFYNRQEFAANTGAAKSYYSTLFFGMLTTSGTVGLLFLLATGAIVNAAFLGPLQNLIYPILALALLRAMGSILWGFLRIEERSKAFNILSVTTKATTIAAVCALLPWVGPYARVYFLGALGVEVILVLGLTIWLVRRGVLVPRCFNLGFFRVALAFGTPLVLYEFAFGVLGSADRFLVRHFVGANALGIYSVAYGLANNVNEVLVAPLNLALLPMYMRIWTSDGAQKTAAFLTVALDLFVLAAAGILAVVAATAQSFVVLLASSKYAGAERLIPVILCGLLIFAANVFAGAGLLIQKRTLKMAGLLVLCAVLNILLNCLLLPIMGLMGGAIATLVSYLVCILSLAWSSNRLLPIHVDVASCGKYVLAALMAWATGSLVKVEPAIVNFLAKSILVLIVYVCALYALDQRVRTATSWLLRWARTQ